MYSGLYVIISDVSINIFKALFELFCVLLDGLLLVDQMGLQRRKSR